MVLLDILSINDEQSDEVPGITFPKVEASGVSDVGNISSCLAPQGYKGSAFHSMSAPV
jgi:hypothetical protein